MLLCQGSPQLCTDNRSQAISWPYLSWRKLMTSCDRDLAEVFHIFHFFPIRICHLPSLGKMGFTHIYQAAQAKISIWQIWWTNEMSSMNYPLRFSILQAWCSTMVILFFEDICFCVSLVKINLLIIKSLIALHAVFTMMMFKTISGSEERKINEVVKWRNQLKSNLCSFLYPGIG